MPPCRLVSVLTTDNDVMTLQVHSLNPWPTNRMNAHLRRAPGKAAKLMRGHERSQHAAMPVGQRLGKAHICKLGAVVPVEQDVSALQAAHNKVLV